ncbi:hypothetical protein [Streptomyces barkulensis]|uniref:SCO4225 family membrane protein n=1 Tax=Streptomyces barkulensis TaxID=1257026 RepID=UPI000C6DA649|nr:hypothetical protein [Streptomyces barkulensis]
MTGRLIVAFAQGAPVRPGVGGALERLTPRERKVLLLVVSMAVVWPVAATAPTRLLALAVPLPDGPVGAALLLGLVSLAAVVNAGVLSAVLRRFRTRAARA